MIKDRNLQSFLLLSNGDTKKWLTKSYNCIVCIACRAIDEGDVVSDDRDEVAKCSFTHHHRHGSSPVVAIVVIIMST
eukprot:1257603-Amphidinium_carterae.1